MEVQTDSERVRHSRRLVLELLGSSVDLSLAGPAEPDGDLARYGTRYGADADPLRATRRSGRRRRARRPRAGPPPRAVGRRRPPAAAETVAQPVKVDNDLYVRDYSKLHPLLQVRRGLRRGRPEHVRDRRRRARLRRPDLDRVGRRRCPESACVYCGNCIGVCPTGALMFKSELDMREAGTWDEAAQTVTDTICPYCGVGCALDAPRPGQPDRQGHLAARTRR